ncbi:hypothetical protein TSAR_005273, partial [Trichomalopsis sarcophagae]
RTNTYYGTTVKTKHDFHISFENIIPRQFSTKQPLKKQPLMIQLFEFPIRASMPFLNLKIKLWIFYIAI